MSKRMTRVLSLILTLVMFVSVSTPAFAWGGGDLGSGWDRDIGEDEIRDFDEPVVEEEEPYDYFQTLEEDSGTQVTVEAPMGSLPTLAELRVETVEAEDIREAVESVVEGEANILVALDISFWLNGVEIEPDEAVRVKISAPELDGKSNLTLVHIPDADEPETIDLIDDEDLSFALGTNEIAFEANSFSVYAVIGEGEEGDNARATVNFYGLKDAVVATYYVKNSDQMPPADDADRDATVQYLDEIVTDPGVGGTLPSGQIFLGWYISSEKNYTTETETMTIDEIRQYLADLEITEGMEVKVWAVIFKVFTVTYLDEKNISIGSDEIRILPSESSAPYTVSKNYSPDDPTKNFEGWLTVNTDVIADAQYEGEAATAPYKMGTTMTISGNITFTVSAPKGRWLVFNENGKGATYIAPQFVKDGEVTKEPTITMRRLGYSFGGWYKDQACSEGQEFSFGGQLEISPTNIYAKWTEVPSAPYTVIFWKQNVAGDGYDFDGSQTRTGNVGSSIAVSLNGTTVTVTGEITYDVAKGFSFNSDDTDSDKTVAPEGNTVVNVYIDRNEYTLTFKTGNSDVTVEETENGQYRILRVTQGYTTTYAIQIDGKWYQLNGQYAANFWTYEIRDDSDVRPGGYVRRSRNNGGYREASISATEYTVPTDTSVVKTITALYEQNIADYFPIVGDNGTTYDNGERWKPQTNTQGWTEVMVFIETMPNESVVFQLDTATRPLKTMYFYVEALPTDTNTVTRNNVKYTLYNTISARYNGVTAEDFSELDGFEKGDAAATITGQALSPHSVYGLNGQYYIASTTEDQSIYFFYKRLKYDINFMDGRYFDGNGNALTSEDSMGQFGVVSQITYGADVSSYNKGGDDFFEPEDTKDGFVLEGWYIDDTCQHPYTFSSLPKGGITVYAKWRQVQYRVFLHPNAKFSDGTNDSSLSWGDEERVDEHGNPDPQAMNFRISYQGKVSLPFGTRDDYSFIGWFKDEACTQPYKEDTKLTDETVTAEYDKTASENYTDKMNKYGEIDGDGWNSDIIGNNGSDRFWITKKLDLYGKWSAILTGADGIGIIYDANGGSNPPSDTKKYKDNVDAIASAASTPSNTETHQFLYWVVQKWNGEDYEDLKDDQGKLVIVYPGAPFTVLKSLAKETNLTPADEDYQEGIVFKAYTMQLRAEYGPKQSAKDTYIDWYQNDKDDTVKVLLNHDKDLQINEAVDIYTLSKGIPTRVGYEFLGWARMPEYTFNDNNEPVGDAITYYENLTEDDLYLKWIPASGDVAGHYELADGTVVTQVAADEKMPYQAFYAVWKEVGVFYVFHSSDGTVDIVDMAQMKRNNQTTYELTADVKDGYLYGGYFKAYLNVTPKDAIAVAGKETAATTFTYDGSKLYVKDDAVNSGKATMYWTKAKAYTTTVEETGGGKGDAMTPVKGQVYFLREIPEAFLGLRVQVIYDWNDDFNITNLFLITTVDNSIYSQAGFKVVSDNKAAFYASYSIQSRNSEKATVIKAIDINEIGGYVGVWDGFETLIKGAEEGSQFTVTPYWITMDGYRVDDKHPSRTFNIGSKTLHAETKDGDFHEVVADEP